MKRPRKRVNFTYTVGTAFRPITELVEQALDFQPADAPADKFRKLSAGLARGGFAIDERAPLLAEWLALPENAGYTALQMGPDLKRRKTLETLAAWSLKLGELQPTVLLVEDLHWCDPSSLELLTRLVAQSATARVLLVGTARPEFTNPWPARSNLQTVTLSRLTRRQTLEMVVAVFSFQGAALSQHPEPGTLNPEVVEQLVARADGIPLFAEELTQAVVEAGGNAALAAIPVTLQDSLLARLDRLSSAKDVAQRAAVLGREFSYALLAATAGLDEGALRQGLERLVDAELLFVRGAAPDAAYTFKHALVQEAAYESLLKRTRQQLHGRVVDVLLTQFAERAAVAPEVVARHAEVAGRMDEAITYHQRAGEHAQTRSAHTEAIGHLRHAIELLAVRPENPKRDSHEAALQLALAGSLRPARGVGHPECEAAYERAQVLSEIAGDTHRLGLALVGLSSFCSNAGNAERGAALAARVLAIAEQSGNEELALLGNAELGQSEFWQAKFASALARFDTARSLSEASRRHTTGGAPGGNSGVMPLSYLDPGLIALTSGSWSVWFLGWPDRAAARARAGANLARQLGDPFNQAYALTVESVVHLLRRDVGTQRERAEEAVAISEAHGFPMFVGVARVCRGAARVAAGETDAVTDIVAGLTIGAETGFQAGAPFLLSWLAEAHIIAGQLVEARNAVEMALAVAAQTGQPGAHAELEGLQGEIALGMMDGHRSGADAEMKAEECFRSSLDIARAQDAKAYELRAATRLARLWRNQGKRAEARDLLAPVYGWFTEGFDTRDLIEAKALLEEL